ncbi:MAG: bifunctional phosphopantothenoylcysteine decarboxylase/phosphopantothenate--cysteine ligase CoaBC [Rhodobacteraceae bacterium]|nr:bifunctional phosphopantothenoylcysteine decarboxylase/phosphopantothenate--cysteine ligase CoaBC [Paracoccaceae bacterium]
MLNGRKVLLIIGGGIAAYKSLDLIRRLSEQGATVTPVLTQAGSQFVTALSVSALAGQKLYQNLFDLDVESDIGHIQLSRGADIIVVAPATADLMAKMASGLANDLASTLLLATDKPVLIAPSMNVRMWHHPATQRNIATLKTDGIHVVGPGEGNMACGEFGLGRMAEVPDIIASIQSVIRGGPLSNRHVIVTSGPTHEPIDPVRYIANRSSGKQGVAIANALLARGARVTFITGPALAEHPLGADVTEVETAAQMLAAVDNAGPSDAAVFAAAVADWHVVGAGKSKIKKTASGALPQFELAENPDILRSVSQRKTNRPELVIGFAAETDNVVENAIAKRLRKGCDWILANDVSPETGIMGGDNNQITFISDTGAEKWPEMSKKETANMLVNKIIEAFGDTDT